MNLKINLIMLLKSGRDAKKKGFEIKSLKVKTISFSLMEFLQQFLVQSLELVVLEGLEVVLEGLEVVLEGVEVGLWASVCQNFSF